MAKREVKKCEHGNKSITVAGCPECCHAAIRGLRLERMLGLDASQILTIVFAFSKGGETPDVTYKRAKEITDGVEAVVAAAEAKGAGNGEA